MKTNRHNTNPLAILDVVREVKAIEQTPCRCFRLTIDRRRNNPLAQASRLDFFTYRAGLYGERLQDHGAHIAVFALRQKRRVRHGNV
jgi:hypothetical protein